METIRSIQTAFRFRPDMLRRMKNRAREKKQSLNAYVEELIEIDLKSSSDRYTALYEQLSTIKMPETISKEMSQAFSYLDAPSFSEEEVENDPRLKAILEKSGRL